MSSTRTNVGWAAVMFAAILMMLVAAIAAPAQSYSVIHSFGSHKDGANPAAGLIGDAAGNLYGTTADGGAFGFGTVFALLSIGGEAVLYSFGGGSDGATPSAALLRDGNGNLDGTASAGGNIGGSCPIVAGCGVVFKLRSPRAETVLHRGFRRSKALSHPSWRRSGKSLRHDGEWR